MKWEVFEKKNNSTAVFIALCLVTCIPGLGFTTTRCVRTYRLEMVHLCPLRFTVNMGILFLSALLLVEWY